jgi:RNA-directed DNA polymerase
MPLGNLTSQFFANVYLNELDYFVKHNLKSKYYIRYVDDFVILHQSREQLEEWKGKINYFLNNNLKLQLHPEKSKIIPLSRGIDFVGFRNFYYFRLLRKRNINNMNSRIQQYKDNKIPKVKLFEIYQGWKAYAKWADSLNIRKEIIDKINNSKTNKKLYK